MHLQGCHDHVQCEGLLQFLCPVVHTFTDFNATGNTHFQTIFDATGCPVGHTFTDYDATGCPVGHTFTDYDATGCPVGHTFTECSPVVQKTSLQRTNGWVPMVSTIRRFDPLKEFSHSHSLVTIATKQHWVVGGSPISYNYFVYQSWRVDDG